MRLSRESAEAEQARRQAQEEHFDHPESSTNAPPPLPARAAPPAVSLLDSPAVESGALAPPLNPIRTGSNNPFASALDAEADFQAQAEPTRYAPPPGPPPPGMYAPPPGPPPPSVYAPPPGPPPVASANPFFGHNRDLSSGSTPSPSASAPTFPAAVDISILAQYDTIILIDDSGSMAGGRWQQVRVALMDVATRVSRVDEDGIEVHFVNSMVEGYNLTVSFGGCIIMWFRHLLMLRILNRPQEVWKSCLTK